MQENVEKYLKILKLEMDDLIKGIEDGEVLLAKRLEEREIRDFVFLENLSVFKMELMGFKAMEKELDTKAENAKSVEDFMDDLDEFVKKRVEDMGFPKVVYELIKRKLEKTAKIQTIT
ncbi:MAG: hypothetical protein FWE72_08150 [Spirochaetaceae bacterium]|nr:hypothetical protein [Spirochaetaceae bacterium]